MRRRDIALAAAGVAAWWHWSSGVATGGGLAADPEHDEQAAPPAGRPLDLASRDGTELHVEVFGPDDAPTIVLVHGWLCSSAVWQHQIRALSDHHRVVAYDQRGHGASQPAAGGDYSSDALAADLDAVLDQAVPPGERVVVAGQSMGAMAVVAWASAHRGEVGARIAGAALVNVGVEDLIHRSTVIPLPAALARVRTAIGERVLTAPLSLPSRTNPLVSRLVKAVALGRAASPAQVAICAEMVLATPTDVRSAFGATLSSFDLAHGLPSLTVPTVVVAGEHDRLTPPVHARSIAAALPEATLMELPGVGHMAPVEAPLEVTEVIRRLVDEHARARRSPGEREQPPP